MDHSASSRRSFLKKGATVLGGAAVAASALGLATHAEAAQTQAPKGKAGKETWDETFDVIVVGSGISGIMAAMGAREKGCKNVIIIEKMDMLGGSSAIAAGDMAALGSRLTKKHKVQDSPELMVKDIAKLSGGYHHPHLTLHMAQQCGRAMDFMVDHGAVFHDKLITQGGHSAPRVHQPVNGCALGALQPMYQHFTEKMGGEIRRRTKLDNIVQDASGRVVGVEVRENYAFNPDLVSEDLKNTSGMPRRYRATKGVVMASGGYGRDIEFRRQDTPMLLPEMLTTAGLAATAGAFRAMLRIGARPVNMAFARFGFHLSATDMRFSCMVHPVTGERCLNEAMPRPAMTARVLELYHSGAKGFPVAIFDKTAVNSFDDPIRTKRQATLGYLREYPTLEALAKAEKIPLAAVEMTLARYNEQMSSGKDADFGKNPEVIKRQRLETAPYYASTVLPLSNRGMGGVLITTKAEVLDLNLNVIPGLYAAGEAASGVHGSMSLISTTLPAAFTYGLIAGESVAALSPNA